MFCQWSDVELRILESWWNGGPTASKKQSDGKGLLFVCFYERLTFARMLFFDVLNVDSHVFINFNLQSSLVAPCLNFVDH